MKRISGSLLVCLGAGVFTAGALFRDPDTRPTAVASAPAPAGSGTVTYGGQPSGGPARGGSGASATLAIADFSFGDVTVSSGGTVNLVNRDGADHTVTAEDGAFNVAIDGGGSGSFVAPSAPGSYAFFCAIHPQMQGTLIVR